MALCLGSNDACYPNVEKVSKGWSVTCKTLELDRFCPRFWQSVKRVSNGACPRRNALPTFSVSVKEKRQMIPQSREYRTP